MYKGAYSSTTSSKKYHNKFILYILDESLYPYTTITANNFILNYLASESDIYLCVHYNTEADNYFLSAKENQRFIESIDTDFGLILLDFYNKATSNNLAIIFESNILIEVVAHVINNIAEYDIDLHDIKLELCLPANLGDLDAIDITETTHYLIQKLEPYHLVIINNDLKQNNNDLSINIDKYFNRQDASNLGYRLINSVEYVIELRESMIMHGVVSNDMRFLDLKKILDKPKKPQKYNSTKSSYILTIFILSQELSINDKLFPTVFSTLRKESFIYVLYDKYNDSYSIKTIKSFLTKQESRFKKRLLALSLPKENCNFKHLIEFLQVIKNPYYLDSKKIRLCIETTLNDAFGSVLTSVTNKLVHTIHPSYLHLIITPQSASDAFNYLQRKETINGYFLPQQQMSGSCIPHNVITQLIKFMDKNQSTTDLNSIEEYALEDPTIDPIATLHKYINEALSSSKCNSE